MMALYRRHFKVRGRGEFPLDMLRYSHCWPVRGEDVETIKSTEKEDRVVQLCKCTPYSRGPFVEIGRWDSFGWKVIAMEGVD